MLDFFIIDANKFVFILLLLLIFVVVVIVLVGNDELINIVGCANELVFVSVEIVVVS